MIEATEQVLELNAKEELTSLRGAEAPTPQDVARVQYEIRLARAELQPASNAGVQLHSFALEPAPAFQHVED